VAVRIAICLGIVLSFGGAAAAQEPSTEPEPILETGELMVMVIKPAYDELQRAMATPPVDRQQWAQLFQKAARLAEFENLILFRPHERSGTPEWKTLATNARKTTATVASLALKALANAPDANVEVIRKAYEDVSGRCNACHRAMSREAPTIKPD
jgi:cytochrome c556